MIIATFRAGQLTLERVELEIPSRTMVATFPLCHGVLQYWESVRSGSAPKDQPYAGAHRMGWISMP